MREKGTTQEQIVKFLKIRLNSESDPTYKGEIRQVLYEITTPPTTIDSVGAIQEAERIHNIESIVAEKPVNELSNEQRMVRHDRLAANKNPKEGLRSFETPEQVQEPQYKSRDGLSVLTFKEGSTGGLNSQILYAQSAFGKDPTLDRFNIAMLTQFGVMPSVYRVTLKEQTPSGTVESKWVAIPSVDANFVRENKNTKVPLKNVIENGRSDIIITGNRENAARDIAETRITNLLLGTNLQESRRLTVEVNGKETTVLLVPLLENAIDQNLAHSAIQSGLARLTSPDIDMMLAWTRMLATHHVDMGTNFAYTEARNSKGEPITRDGKPVINIEPVDRGAAFQTEKGLSVDGIGDASYIPAYTPPNAFMKADGKFDVAEMARTGLALVEKAKATGLLEPGKLEQIFKDAGMSAPELMATSVRATLNENTMLKIVELHEQANAFDVPLQAGELSLVPDLIIKTVNKANEQNRLGGLTDSQIRAKDSELATATLIHQGYTRPTKEMIKQQLDYWAVYPEAKLGADMNVQMANHDSSLYKQVRGRELALTIRDNTETTSKRIDEMLSKIEGAPTDDFLTRFSSTQEMTAMRARERLLQNALIARSKNEITDNELRRMMDDYMRGEDSALIDLTAKLRYGNLQESQYRKTQLVIEDMQVEADKWSSANPRFLAADLQRSLARRERYAEFFESVESPAPAGTTGPSLVPETTPAGVAARTGRAAAVLSILTNPAINIIGTIAETARTARDMVSAKGDKFNWLSPAQISEAAVRTWNRLVEGKAVEQQLVEEIESKETPRFMRVGKKVVGAEFTLSDGKPYSLYDFKTAKTELKKEIPGIKDEQATNYLYLHEMYHGLITSAKARESLRSIEEEFVSLLSRQNAGIPLMQEQSERLSELSKTVRLALDPTSRDILSIDVKNGDFNNLLLALERNGKGDLFRNVEGVMFTPELMASIKDGWTPEIDFVPHEIRNGMIGDIIRTQDQKRPSNDPEWESLITDTDNRALKMSKTLRKMNEQLKALINTREELRQYDPNIASYSLAIEKTEIIDDHLLPSLDTFVNKADNRILGEPGTNRVASISEMNSLEKFRDTILSEKNMAIIDSTLEKYETMTTDKDRILLLDGTLRTIAKEAADYFLKAKSQTSLKRNIISSEISPIIKEAYQNAEKLEGTDLLVTRISKTDLAQLISYSDEINYVDPNVYVTFRRFWRIHQTPEIDLGTPLKEPHVNVEIKLPGLPSKSIHLVVNN
jgi:hypothetical protein